MQGIQKQTNETDAIGAVGFAQLAWRVGSAARAARLIVPGFCDVPTTSRRHIRRRQGQQPVVVLRASGRGQTDLLLDLVEGVLAVNPAAAAVAVERFTSSVGISVTVDRPAA